MAQELRGMIQKSFTRCRHCSKSYEAFLLKREVRVLSTLSSTLPHLHLRKRWASCMHMSRNIAARLLASVKCSRGHPYIQQIISHASKSVPLSSAFPVSVCRVFLITSLGIVSCELIGRRKSFILSSESAILFSTNTASVEPSQSSFPYNLNTSRMCRLCRWLFAAGNFAASESFGDLHHLLYVSLSGCFYSILYAPFQEFVAR